MLAEIDLAAATTLAIVLLIAMIAARLMAMYIRVRVGGGYFCPKCNYNLQGIDADHCPECGLSLAVAGVVEGRASYSIWRVVFVVGIIAFFGLALLLPLAPLMRSIPWYRLHTTGAIINDLKLGAGKPLPAEQAFYSPFGGQYHGSDYDLAYAALDELQRRERNGMLAASVSQDIDDLAISALLFRDFHIVHTGECASNDRLVDRLLDGKLGKEQSDRFFNLAYPMSLKCRSTVAIGDEIPICLVHCSNLPNQWSATARITSQRLDGKEVAIWATDESGFRSSDFYRRKTILASTAGRHSLELEVQIDYVPSNTHQIRKISANFEVIPNRRPIEHRGSPEQLEDFRKSITIRQFAYYGDSIAAVVKAPGAPYHVAYQVYVSYAGSEWRLGSVVAPANSSIDELLILGRQTPDLPNPPAAVDVVFRADDELARSTVNIFRILDGPIVLKDVPITRKVARTATPPAE